MKAFVPQKQVFFYPLKKETFATEMARKCLYEALEFKILAGSQEE
jgi:hypothetical protein